MSRTVITHHYACPYEEAESIIFGILRKNGFKQTEIASGEQVWGKGNGILTVMRYVKVEFGADEFTLSAWMLAGLGGKTGAETDLSGLAAALEKKKMRNMLEEIVRQF